MDERRSGRDHHHREIRNGLIVSAGNNGTGLTVSFDQRKFVPFTFTFLRKPIAPVSVSQRVCVPWGNMMVGRGYLSRQAVALLSFARATGNPELAAALVEKASSLKSQADQIRSASDVSPKAPDVETPPSSRTG